MKNRCYLDLQRLLALVFCLELPQSAPLREFLAYLSPPALSLPWPGQPAAPPQGLSGLGSPGVFWLGLGGPPPPPRRGVWGGWARGFFWGGPRAGRQWLSAF